MKISIITPNYNGARWLARCMDSILSQELAPGDELEYIFMDGASTDNSVAIAEARRDRIATILSEPDSGPADALNKGFQRATGDLIGWLNSDDVYQPGALAKAAEAARSHPSKSFFFGKCRIVDEEGNESRGFPTWVKNACFPFSSHFLIQCINYVSQPASWFRRSALEAIGGELRPDLKAAWDYELMLRLWRKGGGQKIPDGPLADFLWHPGSISGTFFEQQFKEEWEVAAADAGHFSLQAGIHALVRYGIVGCYRFMNRKQPKS